MDTTILKNMTPFAVYTTRWSLYLAYIKELEDIGYTNPYKEWPINKTQMSQQTYLYVCSHFSGGNSKPQYGFSGCSDSDTNIFDLGTRFEEAVNHAKNEYEAWTKTNLPIWVDFGKSGYALVYSKEVAFYLKNKGDTEESEFVMTHDKLNRILKAMEKKNNHEK